MAILVFALILLLIIGLCIYAIDLLPMDPRLRVAAKILLIVIAIILLLNRSGLV